MTTRSPTLAACTPSEAAEPVAPALTSTSSSCCAGQSANARRAKETTIRRCDEDRAATTDPHQPPQQPPSARTIATRVRTRVPHPRDGGRGRKKTGRAGCVRRQPAVHRAPWVRAQGPQTPGCVVLCAVAFAWVRRRAGWGVFCCALLSTPTAERRSFVFSLITLLPRHSHGQKNAWLPSDQPHERAPGWV